MTSERVPGHELLYEGRVLRHGYLGNGPGRAQCRCGEWSPGLPTTAQRKQWHREHKTAIRASRADEAAR